MSQGELNSPSPFPCEPIRPELPKLVSSTNESCGGSCVGSSLATLCSPDNTTYTFPLGSISRPVGVKPMLGSDLTGPRLLENSVKVAVDRNKTNRCPSRVALRSMGSGMMREVGSPGTG